VTAIPTCPCAATCNADTQWLCQQDVIVEEGGTAEVIAQLESNNYSAATKACWHEGSSTVRARRPAASTSHAHRRHKCSEGERGLTPRDCTVDAVTGAAHFSASLTPTRSPLPSSSLVGPVSHRRSMRQSVTDDHNEAIHEASLSTSHFGHFTTTLSRQHVQYINTPAS